MTHHESAIARRRRWMPRIPWWKDEKVLGPISSAGAMRALILTIVLGFAVIAWGGWKIVDITSKLGSIQSTNHSNRLSDQARTENEIAQLQADNRTTVCSVVALTPPGKSAAIDLLAKRYRCPPYKATKNISPGSLRISPYPTYGNTESQSPSAPAMAGGAHSPGMVPTATAEPSLFPSATPTATHSATPSTTPLVNLTSSACSLAGVFC